MHNWGLVSATICLHILCENVEYILMVFGILRIYTFKLWPSLQWNVTWCSLVAGYWHFGTIYCFPSPRVSYQLPSYACNIPVEWSPQMHHSWSLKSYTEGYYGKLLLASEASEGYGYCKTLPPPLQCRQWSVGMGHEM